MVRKDIFNWRIMVLVNDYWGLTSYIILWRNKCITG